MGLMNSSAIDNTQRPPELPISNHSPAIRLQNAHRRTQSLMHHGIWSSIAAPICGVVLPDFAAPAQNNGALLPCARAPVAPCLLCRACGGLATLTPNALRCHRGDSRGGPPLSVSWPRYGLCKVLSNRGPVLRQGHARAKGAGGPTAGEGGGGRGVLPKAVTEALRGSVG